VPLPNYSKELSTNDWMSLLVTQKHNTLTPYPVEYGSKKGSQPHDAHADHVKAQAGDQAAAVEDQ
jgi:hypothetical protein